MANINTDNIALLIVDVQKGFLRRPFGDLIDRVTALQDAYKTVFVTQFYNPDPSNFRRLIEWSHMTVGTPEFELAFSPTKDAIVLQKSSYTCVNAQFIAALHMRCIDTIHICGIDTDICVTKCAVDLFEFGFTPVVLSAFCATNAGPDAQVAALQTLRRYIGKSQVI